MRSGGQDLGFAGALGALSNAEVDVAGVRVPVNLSRGGFGFSFDVHGSLVSVLEFRIGIWGFAYNREFRVRVQGPGFITHRYCEALVKLRVGRGTTRAEVA